MQRGNAIDPNIRTGHSAKKKLDAQSRLYRETFNAGLGYAIGDQYLTFNVRLYYSYCRRPCALGRHLVSLPTLANSSRISLEGAESSRLTAMIIIDERKKPGMIS